MNAGFTIVFIAHEQVNSKTGFITPKGDKRCIDPIIDKCDYVIYLKGNGIDESNQVIKSSAYLAATKEFFARSRIEYTPTFIKEFTAENLTAAIQEGIEKKKEKDNATIVTFEEQQKRNATTELDFDELMATFDTIIKNLFSDAKDPAEEQKISIRITEIIESYLVKGKKVSQCWKNQVEAIQMIVDDLKNLKSVL